MHLVSGPHFGSPFASVVCITEPEAGRKDFKMGFNNAKERRIFEQRMAKQEQKYRKAGMTEEQIQAMLEFDLEVFNSDRRYYTHTLDYDINDINPDTGSLIVDGFRNYTDIYDACSPDYEDSNWWIERIDDPELYEAVMGLSENQKIILSKYVYEGYSLREIANNVLKISSSAMTQRMDVIKRKIDGPSEK